MENTERLTYSGTREAKPHVTIYKAVGRLSDYEDTGLSPEEVKEMQKNATCGICLAHNNMQCPKMVKEEK